MSAIRIRKKIVSDILHLPELGAFIGHTADQAVIRIVSLNCVPWRPASFQ